MHVGIYWTIKYISGGAVGQCFLDLYGRIFNLLGVVDILIESTWETFESARIPLQHISSESRVDHHRSSQIIAVIFQPPVIPHVPKALTGGSTDEKY